MGEANSVRVKCPACALEYPWNTRWAGKKILCKCGVKMRMPYDPTDPPTLVSATSAPTADPPRETPPAARSVNPAPRAAPPAAPASTSTPPPAPAPPAAPVEITAPPEDDLTITAPPNTVEISAPPDDELSLDLAPAAPAAPASPPPGKDLDLDLKTEDLELNLDNLPPEPKTTIASRPPAEPALASGDDEIFELSLTPPQEEGEVALSEPAPETAARKGQVADAVARRAAKDEEPSPLEEAELKKIHRRDKTIPMIYIIVGLLLLALNILVVFPICEQWKQDRNAADLQKWKDKHNGFADGFRRMPLAWTVIPDDDMALSTPLPPGMRPPTPLTTPTQSPSATGSGSSTSGQKSLRHAKPQKPADPDDDEFENSTSLKSVSTPANSAQPVAAAAPAVPLGPPPDRTYLQLAGFKALEQLVEVLMKWAVSFVAVLIIVRMFGYAFDDLFNMVFKLLAIMIIAQGSAEVLVTVFDWSVEGHIGLAGEVFRGIRFFPLFIASAYVLDMDYVELGIFSGINFAATMVIVLLSGMFIMSLM